MQIELRNSTCRQSYGMEIRAHDPLWLLLAQWGSIKTQIAFVEARFLMFRTCKIEAIH